MVRTHIDFSFNDGELSYLVRAVEIEYTHGKTYSLVLINENGHHTYKAETLEQLLKWGRDAVAIAVSRIGAKYN